MIVGVGGQGSLLASRLLGNVILAKGYDVKVSEVHGMSQRGGSVVTYVKYGEKVFSPVIEKGEADVIISFEQLEAARWIPYLKKGGKVIIKIRDRGCGIADVRQAMQPLFTTAAEEERAGLGFAVMQSFCDRVRVSSAVGKGTTVTLEKQLGNG